MQYRELPLPLGLKQSTQERKKSGRGSQALGWYPTHALSYWMAERLTEMLHQQNSARSHPLGYLRKPPTRKVCAAELAEATTQCPKSHMGCQRSSLMRCCPAKLDGKAPLRMVYWEATLQHARRSCSQGGHMGGWPPCMHLVTTPAVGHDGSLL